MRSQKTPRLKSVQLEAFPTTASGLASADQLVERTSLVAVRTDQTSAGLPLVILTPSREVPIEQAVSGTKEELFATRMTEDFAFQEGLRQGLAGLSQGRYSRLEDVKRRLGDV